jgi:folylpolyglutamate synthase/dihydropteroate synthase
VAAAFASRGVDTRTFPTVEQAVLAARADADEGDLILVTGSLYTVADARRTLLEEPER